VDERTAINLRDDEKIIYKFQPALGGTAPKGNVLLFNHFIELIGDTEVLGVATLELVAVGFLEPYAPIFIVDEKTEYD
jgi:hypothetical protein